VPISISEWAYTGSPANSFKDVPAYAWAFQEMFRHSELFQMATFTFATSLLSTNRTEAVLNPSGLLFKLYRDHFGSIPVAVSGNSPQPVPPPPNIGLQPKVNPGSDTYPLDVAAALSDDGKTLTVALVNPTESAQQLRLIFRNVDLTGEGNLWRMAPESLTATIVVGQKAGVEVERHTLDAAPDTVRLPPYSVSIYELAVGKNGLGPR